ncbi:MAG: EscU/YscU/HrcU family type III secretion system export apparatus switch protein [Pilosibacter sp.]
MVLMSAFERLLEQKAVALQYSPEKDTAPVIVASGMGYMAEKITEAARKSGVPVYEDDSLATLFKQITAGSGCAGRIISGDHRDLYLLFRICAVTGGKRK